MSLSKWILLAFTFALFALTIPSYRTHIFALNFVDEDDNIVIGNYALEGKKLYQDVYTQHQPSMFLISAVIQKYVKTDNIMMVVKRHREFMIAWSCLWIIALVWRFGAPLLVATWVIELSKIVLLGNLFLAESIVIYPLLYLFAFIYDKKVKNVRQEIWLISAIFWFLIFSLTPLWPLLFLCYALLIFYVPDRKQLLISTFTIFTLLAILLLRVATVSDYIYDAFYINYKYYIPLTTPTGFFESIIKALFAPFIALFAPSSGNLIVLIKLVSFVYLIGLAQSLWQKKYWLVAMPFVILFSTSLRYIDPSNTLYGVFHMLPWFAVLVYLTISRVFIMPRYKNIIVFLIILFAINVSRTQLWDKRDPATDFYVHYSPSVDIREAVSILSSDSKQTIWVEPVMYWPHWRTGASSYTSMVNYYGWMDQTPPMKDLLSTTLQKELPTLVYAETTSGIGEYLDSYSALVRDGKPTNLYLRKDKIDAISSDALGRLSYYRFEIN